jgi:hypothetical protein
MDDFLPQAAPAGETKRGHEADKPVVRTLVIFAAALVGVGIIIELALRFVMEGFSGEAQSLRALAPPRFKDDSGLFPSPRLQADPATELSKLKEESLARLNGYGWVDEDAGVAHIPIDRAIDILAESGLPAIPARSETGKEAAPEAKPRSPAGAPSGSVSKQGRQP